MVNIGLIGAGSLGSALALRMHQRGLKINAIVSKTGSRAETLSEKVQCRSAGTNIELLKDSNVIFIAVPDSQIPDVAERLLPISYRAKTVTFAHTSGTLTSSAFQRLKEINTSKMYIASVHPMQTFPRKIVWNKERLANHFENIYFGVEGEAAALKNIGKIIKQIGGQCVRIPKKFKALYHMGGVFSSNFLLAILHMSKNLYAHADINEANTIKILMPIIIQTLKNMKDFGIDAALTGPASRNDSVIIKRHLNQLAQFEPKYRKVYRDLTKICYQIAAQK